MFVVGTGLLNFCWDLVLKSWLHEDPPLTDCSQPITWPVLPPNFTPPPFPPAHTVVEPLTEPPTDNGFTVMVETVENSIQVPTVILARYCVVVVRLRYGCVVVAFVIVVHKPPPLMELSHLDI